MLVLQGFSLYQVKRDFHMLLPLCEDHLSCQSSHLLKVSGDSGNAVEKKLLQRCLIIGDYPNLLPNLQVHLNDVFQQDHQIIFHQIGVNLTLPNLLLRYVVYDVIGKGILLAKINNPIHNIIGEITVSREDEVEGVILRKLFPGLLQSVVDVLGEVLINCRIVPTYPCH